VAAPVGFAVEALPVGADESGAVLLRLQIVPRPGQPAVVRRRSIAAPAILWPTPRSGGAASVREEARAVEKITQKGG
jgi:hypothetical protein